MTLYKQRAGGEPGDEAINGVHFQIEANLAMLFHYPLPLSLLMQLIAP